MSFSNIRFCLLFPVHPGCYSEKWSFATIQNSTIKLHKQCNQTMWEMLLAFQAVCVQLKVKHELFVYRIEIVRQKFMLSCKLHHLPLLLSSILNALNEIKIKHCNHMMWMRSRRTSIYVLFVFFYFFVCFIFFKFWSEMLCARVFSYKAERRLNGIKTKLMFKCIFILGRPRQHRQWKGTESNRTKSIDRSSVMLCFNAMTYAIRIENNESTKNGQCKIYFFIRLRHHRRGHSRCGRRCRRSRFCTFFSFSFFFFFFCCCY